jgi:hypothetical protein
VQFERLVQIEKQMVQEPDEIAVKCK